MPNNSPDVILFIGAGFSKPAGVPLMTEFVNEFTDKLKNKGTNYINYFNTIKKMMAQTSGQDQPDLEILMDILYRLAQGDTLEMSAWKENDELASFNEEIRNTTRIELENLIREKCVIDPLKTDLKYLEPIRLFYKNNTPLDIFSVNYDDVIEVFCHRYKYNLEDGFGLYWEPERFEKDKNIHIRLYKLHGSVLWYKTDQGAFCKILLQVPYDNRTLVVGEKLETLIAYPVAGKPIHVAPLAYAMNKLRERLENVKQCVVVGYSMRDQHIRDIFIESIRRNPQLKIILVDPCAFRIVNNMVYNPALRRAIVPASFTFEEICGKNNLLRIIDFLKMIRDKKKYDPKNRPMEAVQYNFNALQYMDAFDMIRTEVKMRNSYHFVSHNLSLGEILGGLCYMRVLSKYDRAIISENDVVTTTIDVLKLANSYPNYGYQEARRFVSALYQAIEWVSTRLMGEFGSLVQEFTKYKKSAFKSAHEKIRDYGDVTGYDWYRSFASKIGKELIRWHKEEIELDLRDNWLFE